MRSPLAGRRLLHTKAVTTVAALAMGVLAVPAAAVAHADTTPTIPTFTNGYGLTVVNDPDVGTGFYPGDTESASNFTITVTTPEVADGTNPDTNTAEVGHHIRIILPADYYSDPTKRYPVLYFLHGGGDDPVDQGEQGNLQPYFASDMITVLPDGGPRGWYVNWQNQGTAAGAQNWETFEIDQVIPFIDANLRTIADKRDRAIAGLSMGGFGAFHLAEDNPSLFSNVASLSGAIDMSDDDLLIRSAIATLEQSDAPSVPDDATFGSLIPFFDGTIDQIDPSSSTNLENLAGMNISIYTGAGSLSTAPGQVLEMPVQSAAQWTENRLNADGIPSYYVDYGDGSNWGAPGTCDGGHDWGCWEDDLNDYIPRLETAFGLN